jgi:UDP-3-O-[3-hydroxymyristoyl] glucosamine N-acyltransferase
MWFSLQELVSGEGLVPGESKLVDGVFLLSSLKAATVTSVAFYFSKYFDQDLKRSQAGAFIVGREALARFQSLRTDVALSRVLIADEPYLTMARLSQRGIKHPEGISPDAILGAGALIGARSWIQARAIVGEGVSMGEDCVIGPGVVLYPGVILGHQVTIHAGSVIGSEGFGFVPVFKEGVLIKHEPIRHCGGVRIGNRVSIGALCTIDQGTFDPTVLEDEVRLDNQVHVGHNCFIGRGAALCGGCRLAGHARIGAASFLGGMVGVVNQVEIGEKSTIGAQSLVTRSVPSGSQMMGHPLRPMSDHLRLHARLNQTFLRAKKERGTSK